MKLVRWLDGKISDHALKHNGRVDWGKVTLAILVGCLSFVAIVFLLFLLLAFINLIIKYPAIIIGLAVFTTLIGVPYLYVAWRARAIRTMAVLAAETLADAPEEIRINQSAGYPLTTTNIRGGRVTNTGYTLSNNKFGMGNPPPVKARRRPIKTV